MNSTLARISMRQLGLVVLMASMTVLFVGSIVAYLITRAQNPIWRTAEMPGLPPGLLGSTLMLVGVSFAMHRAVRDVRRNRVEALTRDLWLTLAFAVAFLVTQAQNWQVMGSALHGPGPQTLYPFTFLMLTGLHAAHVLGGFVPLGIVIARATRRHYTSSQHEGVALCRQYWDYLGVVWLVLLGTLYLAT